MADGIKKVSENVIIDKRALVITDPTVKDNDAISIGALQSNPAKKGLKIKVAKNTYSYFDAAQFIMPGSITTELLKDKCVTSFKLADKSVTEPKLADDSVSERAIIDANVTNSKLANNSVTESKIADLAVARRHLQDKCVDNFKIEDNTIRNEKLLNKTITNAKIADATIITSLLADKSVNEFKIALDSVKYEHLKDGSVYDKKIKNAAIKNVHMSENAINTINVLNGAITGPKISDNQIDGNHIINSSIESVHISNGAIIKDKLASDSVTTSAVVNKAITKDKLAEDVVSLIGDPVQYDKDNNVELRNNLAVKGDVNVVGSLTANKVYNAVFMDIAEAYIPGEELSVGDIVEIRENSKVYKCTETSLSIVGVVSEGYATCYGATERDLEEGIKVAIGLIGKVPVNVCSPVKPGDRIIAGANGIGYVESVEDLKYKNDTPSTRWSYIGKAIEVTEEPGLALCLIYPN